MLYSFTHVCCWLKYLKIKGKGGKGVAYWLFLLVEKDSILVFSLLGLVVPTLFLAELSVIGGFPICVEVLWEKLLLYLKPSDFFVTEPSLL